MRIRNFRGVNFGDEGEPVEKEPKKEDSGSGALNSVVPGAGEAIGCAKQMCGESQAAADTAKEALGPSPAYIPQSQLDAMAMDKSPAGIARYQEALAYNAEVERQLKERQTIIDQFVRDAMGGQATPEQVASGDKLQMIYDQILQKHGKEVGTMTLQEFKDAHPEDANRILSSLGTIFPKLAGFTPDMIWATIPQFIKDTTMNDLVGMIPKSTWNTGQDMVHSDGAGLPILPIAIAGVGVIALLYLLNRRST